LANKNNTSPTILVVDDNTYLCRFYCEALERAGYRLLVANNGRSGLKLYQQHQVEIDLVVSDKNMPGLDGIELFYELRRNNPLVKCIMVSGSITETEAQALKAQGLLAVIQKPFGFHTLVEHIKVALNQNIGCEHRTGSDQTAICF
jgi:two-component system response regulator GlrR